MIGSPGKKKNNKEIWRLKPKYGHEAGRDSRSQRWVMVVGYNKCKEGLDQGETAQIARLEHGLAQSKSFPPR